MKVRRLRFFGAMVALWVAMTCAQGSTVDSDAVLFQFTTDKSEYRWGESALVRFTVENRGIEPIYLNRNMGTCSMWTGHVELTILDHRDHKVLRAGCDVFVTRIPDSRLKEALNSSEWILLLPGKAYSSQQSLDLPRTKGRYFLVADLWPPAFSNDQLQLLASQGMRVLQSAHSAPRVTIAIK
jgi:hypothetical protein